MALDSYDALKASVADWLNKSTLSNIDARAADFVTLFEAQANRELDVREMTGLLQGTISGEDMALPCDFGGVKSFRLEGLPSEPLHYAKPEELDEAFGTGRPYRYTITDRITFDPVPDAEYSFRMRYRKRIPALSLSRQSNWLLQKHPDAYLYGALSQAIVYFRDDDRSTINARYAAAIDAIDQDEKRTAYPSTLNASARRI